MNYIENIYICLAAPLLIAIFCVNPIGRRSILFILGGMTTCLLSSYISTFFATLHGVDILTASVEIAPIIEEVMKLMPVLFYLLVFEPNKYVIPSCAIMTAVGFATFENVCYLMQNGATNIIRLLIRGFGTGALHVVCGYAVAIGIVSFWDHLWLRLAGTFGLLAVTVSYHGIYNLLVSQTGMVATIGSLIPMVSTILGMWARSKIFGKKITGGLPPIPAA